MVRWTSSLGEMQNVKSNGKCPKCIIVFFISSNVIYNSEQADKKALSSKIESKLEKEFKKKISVILRSQNDLKNLELLKPFKEIKVTPNIQLYITFLSEEARPRTIKIPYATLQEAFRIILATPTEVFSVLDLSKGKGTPDIMNILEKEFNTSQTTRSWKTVLKVLN